MQNKYTTVEAAFLLALCFVCFCRNFSVKEDELKTHLYSLKCFLFPSLICFFSLQFKIRNRNNLGGEEYAVLETFSEKPDVNEIV